MRQFSEDRRKLKELILYISQQCASDENYGSTLLNKLLFFADFLAYAKLGQPITGTEYMRELHGPVPRVMRAGRQNPVQELEREGALHRTETELKGVPKKMKRITPVVDRAPDLSVFSPEELELVNEVIESFRGWTAGKISKYTHQFVMWQSRATDAAEETEAQGKRPGDEVPRIIMLKSPIGDGYTRDSAGAINRNAPLPHNPVADARRQRRSGSHVRAAVWRISRRRASG